MKYQKTIGQFYHNPGVPKIKQEIKPFELDHNRTYYIFDVLPMGAVRMTKRDTIFTNPNHPDPKKRQRPEVTRYFDYQNKLWDQYSSKAFKFPNELEVVFCIPMPSSWSEKTKAKMNKMPCEVRPDIDNLVKAFMDALKIEDGNVWRVLAEKRYAYKGSIILFL